MTSVIFVILKPFEFNPLMADSLPEPGPLTCISKLSKPAIFTLSPTASAAFCAAKGVLFLEPLNPCAPELDCAIALPCLSVILMSVLCFS